MRVAIYGAGSIGTVVGAYVAASGKDIDLITRNASHVAALNENGAQIVGNDNLKVKVNAFTPDKMSGVYDIIFLTTKQRDNSKILANLRDYLADDGVICTLQNGLPEPSVTEVVGRNRCIGCVATFGASTVKDGVVKLTSKKRKMSFAIGAIGVNNPKLKAVEEYLACAGKVTIADNFFGMRWSKLALNCSLSPLSAITGFTFGKVAKNKYTREIALSLINEVFAVAKECGIELEPVQGTDIAKIFTYNNGVKKFFLLRIMPLTLGGHRKLISGMYDDLKSHRRCDIDQLNGVVHRLGNKFGLKTPVNDEVIKFCHEIENGGKSVSTENAKLLYDKIFNK